MCWQRRSAPAMSHPGSGTWAAELIDREALTPRNWWQVALGWCDATVRAEIVLLEQSLFVKWHHPKCQFAALNGVCPKCGSDSTRQWRQLPNLPSLPTIAPH